MARRFTAASTEGLTTAAGGVVTPTAFSFAFVIRHVANGAAQQLFRVNTAANGPVFSGSFDGSARLSIFNSSTSVAGTVAANDWTLVTASKPAGNSPVTAGYFTFSSGSWVRETLGTLADPTNTPPASVAIGRHPTLTQYFNGDMAAGALWSRALSTSELDQLPLSLANWLSAGPTAMWVFDQASPAQALLDWTGGGANQTAIIGTSVSTDSVPVLGYGHPIILSTRTAPTGGGEPGPNSGTAALTLPALSAAGAGTPSDPGSAALALPSTTAAAAGTPRSSGTAALALPASTGQGTGTPASSATAAFALPPLAAVGTATPTASGAAALTLPAMQAAGTSASQATATADLILPALTAAAAGTPAAAATATAALPAVAAAAAGAPTTTGAAVLTLPPLHLAGVADNSDAPGTANLSLPALLAAGTGAPASVAVAALLLPALTAAGNDNPVYPRRPGILTAGSHRSRLTAGTLRGPST
jgi:hypothetical protein